MRVLVTVGIFPPDIGGPATFVPKIAKYFQDELNYEIEILTLSDNKNSNINDDFSVKRIDRNLPIIYRWLKTIFTIYKLGKNKDLIFVNGLGTEATIANIFLNKKIIRKIVGDPVWERAYSKAKISESFDEFQGRNKWRDTTVHAFVDRVTGEVYKPAGWSKPAKHVRYDLSNDFDRDKLHDPNRIDWAGGYLYLR